MPLILRFSRARLLTFAAPLLGLGTALGVFLILVDAPIWVFFVAPVFAIPILVRELSGLRAPSQDPPPAPSQDPPPAPSQDEAPPPSQDESPPPSQGQLDVVWQEILVRLRHLVPDATYRLWLEPLKPVGLEAGTLYLEAPPGIHAWVERRYFPLIATALADTGSSLREVSFGRPSDSGERSASELGLNPSYTLDRLVIYPGNRLAHAAALAVAEAPSDAYNPLFIHGIPGLGKTHLLTAIANYLRVNSPTLNVRYTTAEAFTNEFMGTLRSTGDEAFKARYRDLDVLLIDDVQFLEGKVDTEEEFFRTFNFLYESGSQIVLSADRIPSELSSLAAHLRDRFEGGLTVAVESPNLAGRLAVLQQLIQESGLPEVDDKALAAVAQRIDANVRQLHGALTRVVAHASLTALPISPELIDQVIPQVSSRSATSVESIQRRVADHFGVSKADLVGPSRTATVVRSRQVAILLTRELTDLSLPQIGRVYGGRDHSTVLNSLRRVEANIAEDPGLEGEIDEIFHELLEGAPFDRA